MHERSHRGSAAAIAQWVALFTSCGIRHKFRGDDKRGSAAVTQRHLRPWDRRRRSGQDHRSGPCSSMNTVGVERNTSVLTGP